MVKSVLGVNHQGLRDWVIQRITAIFMAVYTVSLVVYLALHPGLTYSEWRMLFSPVWLKIATIFFFLSLSFHAWVGVWTIFTDYVKPFILRAFLNLIVMLVLSGCFIWALMILWSL